MEWTVRFANCLVIGAGMAGFVAARRLAASGRSVIVVDKGRSVGGRMATRTIGEARFDHGAQFFTARDPRFARLLTEWFDEDAIDIWTSAFPTGSGRRLEQRSPFYEGNLGMTSVPKLLARGLDVVTGATIADVAWNDGMWEALTA